MDHSAPVRQVQSVWMRRLSLVLMVMIWIELGTILLLLPWSRTWLENGFVYAHPGLRHLLENNFLRGGVSGIGVIDIFLGLWEAITYRES